MQGEKSTNEVDDEVRIPLIARHFEQLPSNAEVQEVPIKIPDLDRIATRSRIEIAEMIANLLDYNPGVVGFRWVIGQDRLYLKYVDGFEQRNFDNEKTREDFVKLVITILKSRQNILKIEWDFGEDHVKIRYLF